VKLVSKEGLGFGGGWKTKSKLKIIYQLQVLYIYTRKEIAKHIRYNLLSYGYVYIGVCSEQRLVSLDPETP
jgi:hypothetical protein